MKPVYAHLGGALALTFAIAACVPQPRPAPTPTPVARPAMAPTPTPSARPASQATAWMDQPASEGDWFYRTEGNWSLALFGGEETEADFILRCERGRGAIRLAFAGTAAGTVTMRIRTETMTRILPVQADDDAPLPYLVAILPARDPLLDAMALTKGRFAVEIEGGDTLYLPSWAEVTRVIEDCR
jgi:hypothetical protein